MKLLLDTHVWLWSLLEPEKLSPRVRNELQNPDNAVWLSPISTWELLLLCEKGRVVLSEDAGEWVVKAMKVAPLVEAPVTHEVALETRTLQLAHRDPADRFLAATAKVFGLTLVTSDERLWGVPGVAVLRNR